MFSPDLLHDYAIRRRRTHDFYRRSALIPATIPSYVQIFVVRSIRDSSIRFRVDASVLERRRRDVGYIDGTASDFRDSRRREASDVGRFGASDDAIAAAEREFEVARARLVRHTAGKT